jgi:putative salt-induced outer membrane protein
MLVLFLQFLAAVPAWAQQTPPAAPPPPPPVWAGTAEFSAVATTGNTSTQSIGLSGETTYRPGAWRFDGKAGFVRQKAEGVVSARSVTTLERLSRELNARVSVFGQHDFLRNVFAGIRQRHTAAAGVTLTAVQSDRQVLRVDAGAGYAHERRVAGSRLSSATALGGGQYTVKLSATSEFAETLRVVASLEDGSDWRLDQAASLTAQVTSRVSLKLSHVVRFVNAPVAGFEKTDTIVSAALVAKF